MKKTLFLLLFVFTSISTFAHNPDQSYLYFRIFDKSVEAEIHATAVDLNRSLNLGLDKFFTIEELNEKLPIIEKYIQDNLDIEVEGKTYEIEFMEPDLLVTPNLGSYAKINFLVKDLNEIPDELVVDYRLFFNENKKHRALLLQQYNWRAGIIDNEGMHNAIFSPKDTKQVLDLTTVNMWKGFYSMIKMGVWHIWIGIDHILFLVALLLPSVVRRFREKKQNHLSGILTQWKGVDQFSSAFWYILRVVTFFTIAHTITLSLSALGLVKLPSNLVEAIIAFSIALAALHNITPIFKQKEWLIAFLFGLFHGFGFAGVLAEKGLHGEFLVPTLLGFNLGVEFGQVLIILAVFPVLYLLRKTKLYNYLIFFGSIFLIIVSLIWTIERIFGIDIEVVNTIKNLFA